MNGPDQFKVYRIWVGRTAEGQWFKDCDMCGRLGTVPQRNQAIAGAYDHEQEHLRGIKEESK